MNLTRRRRLTAFGLGLLVPFAACADVERESPETAIGDQIPGRVVNIKAGETTAVLTPAGRLSVSFADPVSKLAKDDTTDLVAREAPDGGTFVPMVWSFRGDEIYGKIAQLFGDREALEIELVADDERYSLIPPDASQGERAQYVAVMGDARDLSLEVTYGTVTQALVVESGRLDKGAAEDLYDLPKTKIKMEDCPIKTWFREPSVFPHYECSYATAVPTPYVANTWAEPGHTWVAVTVSTNLALFATGELNGRIASYRVVSNTELSTIDGEEALGIVQESVSDGSASGTLVFDIEGKLPKTLNILREYKLTLTGSSGKTEAPERRSVRIGGDVDLFY